RRGCAESSVFRPRAWRDSPGSCAFSLAPGASLVYFRTSCCRCANPPSLTAERRLSFQPLRRSTTMRRISVLAALGFLALGLGVAPFRLASHTLGSPPFVHFESPHVHPAVMTPAGNRLLVVNTPDGYLRVFNVAGDHPIKVEDIPVGLEP